MYFHVLKGLYLKAILFLALSMILTAHVKTEELETYWSAEHVNIDGQMTEWINKPTHYIEKNRVMLGLRNDSENLYFLFRFNNQEWVRLIRMSGVTLWLDNSGKGKKDFGIHYAGGFPPPDIQKPGREGDGGFSDNLTPEQKGRLKLKQESTVEQLTVIYKKSKQEILIPAGGSKGPAVCFDSLQGIYTFEFRVPLKKRDISDFTIDAQPGQKISLGLEWGELKMSDHERKREQMGGEGMMPPGGGMDGPPPGGGGPPGRGKPAMQKPEKQEIWVKARLALPPAE
ncbi:MAG: hypothetical protein OEV55_00990 [candidate division Zixibacteria bacterium]|nr:hypothetical protein [candidate division Zixibacteria bacterium]